MASWWVAQQASFRWAELSAPQMWIWREEVRLLAVIDAGLVAAAVCLRGGADGWRGGCDAAREMRDFLLRG